MKKDKKKKNDLKNKEFLRGYEFGKKQDEEYTKLGKAIVDCLYEFFEPVNQ